MNILIEKNILDIQKIFKQYKVEKAFLFGSMANDTFNKNSDADFLIKFDDKIDFIEYGENYFNLMYDLQNLLKMEVDLLAEETITNPYLLETINFSKIQIV